MKLGILPSIYGTEVEAGTAFHPVQQCEASNIRGWETNVRNDDNFASDRHVAYILNEIAKPLSGRTNSSICLK